MNAIKVSISRRANVQRSVRWGGPEGAVLKAQAEGLGTKGAQVVSALKGPFTTCGSQPNGPFRAGGIRVGLFSRPSAWALRTAPLGPNEQEHCRIAHGHLVVARQEDISTFV